MCAWLHSDGFDWPVLVGDMSMRWDNAPTSNGLVAAASTAFGVGGAYNLSAGGTVGNLNKTLPSNEATVYINFRARMAATAGGATQGLVVALADGGTDQCGVMLAQDGSIKAVTALPNSTPTVIGTGTASGIRASVTWDSWQVAVTIHNTAGSIEVRKNGSTTPVLSLTSINTRNGTANAYCNKIRFGIGTSCSTEAIDDVFVCSSSGAAPNTWPGDVRAVTHSPSGSAQSQFTGNTSTATQGQTSSTSTNVAPSSNIINYCPFTPTYPGTVSTLSATVSTGGTGKLNAAIYADSAGAPGALLQQAAELTNPVSGTATFTLASSVSLAKGTQYWLALWSNAGTGVIGCSGASLSSTLRFMQTLTYSATFPASAGAAGSAGNGPYIVANITAIPTYSLLSTAENADTDYVYSSTVGQEDLYSFPTILSAAGVTPASIIGVVPFCLAKKSDSGARTIGVQCKSGATDTAVFSSSAVGLSYSFCGGWLALDPNTGAAWANAAAVDAATAGPKVVA